MTAWLCYSRERSRRMKKLTQKQINKILEEHKHWLNKDCKGWETMMADFSSCDLRGADLSGANHLKMEKKQ